MTPSATPNAFVEATAAAMRGAYGDGYRHGLTGGSRSKDPYINRDRDLHLCWDTGWVNGAEDRDRKQRAA